MNIDVTTTDDCSIHSTRPRNGIARLWPRSRRHGWSDPRTRYSSAGDVAVSLARVPR